MISYYVNRNQADREAFVIHQTEKFDLVYYFMPNGAMYLNKIFQDGTYQTVSQKKLLEYVDRNPDVKPEVIAMLNTHNEFLQDLTLNLKRHDYRRIKYKGMDYENTKLIAFLKG